MTEGEPVTLLMGRRKPILFVLGIAVLFSGAASLAHIVAGTSLPLSLAVTASLLAGSALFIWRRTDDSGRAALRSLIVRGLAIGLLATLLYDASRTLLSQLDPSPYQPFEVLTVFGYALLGRAAAPEAALAAGVGFHLLNGVSFGLAYVFLLGRLAVSSRRWALASGIGWGLFLETFQLTLYPGWLNIEAYREFVTVSFLGHFVYGATLGLMSHRLLAGTSGLTAEEDAGLTAEEDAVD